MNTNEKNKSLESQPCLLDIDAEIFNWIVCKIQKYKTEITLIKSVTTTSKTSVSKQISWMFYKKCDFLMFQYYDTKKS